MTYKYERATERACEVLDILKSDGQLYDNVLTKEMSHKLSRNHRSIN